MKRILFLYSLWVLCLAAPMLGQAAKPWGVLDEVASSTEYTYAVDHLLDNRPVLYAVSKDITPQEEKYLLHAFNEWPRATLAAIEQAGRQQEFADIVPMLKRGLSLTKTAWERADVTLEIDPGTSICGAGAGGCHITSTRRVVVPQNNRSNIAETLVHEIGHDWGLGDQYEECRSNSHPVYSSDANKVEGSVMSGSYTTKGKLTCDDVDGFINLIDLRLSQSKGKFSARARKGWKTFCRSSNNFYKEAKTVNRKWVDSVPIADSLESRREYDKKGNLVSKEEDTFLDDNLLPLFGIKRKDRVTRDNATGKILSIESSTGTPLCLAQGGKPSIREYTYLYNNIQIKCKTGSKEKIYNFPLSYEKKWTIALSTQPPVHMRQAKKGGFDFEEYDFFILLDNYKFPRIRIAQNSWNTGMEASLEISASNEPFSITLDDNRKPISYSISQKGFEAEISVLPVTHKAVIKEMKYIYDNTAPYARSFYTNFYRPAMGMDTRTQTKTEVKSKLFTQK